MRTTLRQKPKQTRLIKGFLLCAFLLISLPGVQAQSLRSGYFINTLNSRHKLNPVLIPDQGYVGIPALGHINAMPRASFSPSAIIYNNNGKATTFLDDCVSTDDFLSKLDKNNAIFIDLDVSLLSGGFYKWGGFNTIEYNLRSSSQMNVPKDMFRFMKEGLNAQGQSKYSFEDMNIITHNYTEILLGHARPITERLTLGGNLKILQGWLKADLGIDHMNASKRDPFWLIDAAGHFDIASGMVTFETDKNGKITKTKIDRIGSSGFGLGLDLGGSYQISDDWFVAAGVTDFGFLRWGKQFSARTQVTPFDFEGFEKVVKDAQGNQNDLGEQLEQLNEDFKDLTYFEKTSSPDSKATFLKSTLSVGTEYSFENRKISIGLLSTTRFGLSKIWTELMLSTNYRPAEWFSAALTGAYSNYGFSWGWLVNFTPRGFHFFLGTDHMMTRFSSIGVPLGKASANISLGMSVPLGKKYGRDFYPVD